MNVLIVDDDIPYLNSLRDEVNWQSVSVDFVYTADCADAAIRILESQPVELLITDVEMPGMSGISLIEWCRERKLCRAFIILSNYPDFSYAQKAISLGAGAYMLKTSDRQTIENIIRSTVAKLSVEKPQEPQSAQMSKIKYYVSEHITETIRRDDVASYVGFSPDYLSSYFRKEEGCTLNSYIGREKVRYAQKLLLQTDLPVSVIAQNLGFETSSHFTSLFRKITGKTPREYRKSRRESG